ncbi:MAG TPA: response regulator transcription factor [Elusimicrobiota bacterium]|jgi:DNA-binding response OmpR family regulator|nr:response regulator transcription factor [Elusimicrobiota bacterium]
MVTKEKILIVEDEADLVRLLRHGLEKEKFRVSSARDAETGLKLVRKEKPDLILLDVMLPKMDGLEFLRTIRSQVDIPILLLTAKRSEMDRILGLKLGADDYIVKPFSLAELQARITAHLRRHSAASEDGAKKSVAVGEVAIDFERHETTVKGEVVYLAPKEFAILKLLIEANGRVLSREQLLRLIWGHDEDVEIDTRTVDQHIARLRRKLRSAAERIATVPNFGYQFKMK